MSEKKGPDGVLGWTIDFLRIIAALDLPKSQIQFIAAVYSHDITGKHGQADPSLDTLADHMRIRRCHVANTAGELDKAGIVSRRRGGGAGNSTTYFLPTPDRLKAFVRVGQNSADNDIEKRYREQYRNQIENGTKDRKKRYENRRRNGTSGGTRTNQEQISNKKERGSDALMATAPAPEVPKGYVMELRRRLEFPDTQKGENRAWKIAGDYVRNGGDAGNLEALVAFGRETLGAG